MVMFFLYWRINIPLFSYPSLLLSRLKSGSRHRSTGLKRPGSIRKSWPCKAIPPMKYHAISNPLQAKLPAMGSVLNLFMNDQLKALASGELIST